MSNKKGEQENECEETFASAMAPFCALPMFAHAQEGVSKAQKKLQDCTGGSTRTERYAE